MSVGIRRGSQKGGSRELAQAQGSGRGEGILLKFSSTCFNAFSKGENSSHQLRGRMEECVREGSEGRGVEVDQLSRVGEWTGLDCSTECS